MISIIYNILILLIIVATFGVLIAKNPVHSVFFLVLVFCLIAILVFSLNVNFLGIIFIIVYVGAIAVLFLFVVMMLNIKYIELNESFIRYFPIIFIIIFVFSLQLIKSFYVDWVILENNTMDSVEWYFFTTHKTNIKNIGYLI